jgi:outer membrane receptor protein involved in Fe transport
VQDKPFVKELLFDTGYRYSSYSTDVKTHTYKFELQYAPIADYRFRASYDKAIRAPSIVELYNPQLVGLIQYGNDPCAPTIVKGALVPAQFSAAQCLNTGVTAAQYGNGGSTNTVPQGTAGQLSQIQGGNPQLKPDQAETYTFGVNFAPSQVPGLTGSLDYYHIAITNEVGVVPASFIVNQCANTADPTYCKLLFRSPVTGSLTGATIAGGGYIVQNNVNIGAAGVSGIDAQVNYKHDLPAGFGGLAFEMNGAYLQHATSTPLPGQHTYDCAGLFGFTCQTVNPRWHHIFRTTWLTPWDFTGSITWRYIAKVSQDNNTGDPTLHFNTWGAYDFFNATIPSYSYVDLEATWHVNKILTVRAGANNVLDKDPPLINSQIVSGGAANTYDVYDMFGRQLFVSFTARF